MKLTQGTGIFLVLLSLGLSTDLFGQYDTFNLKWNVDSYQKLTFVNAKSEKMPYRLLKPNKIDSLAKYPLVIMLHGTGEGMNMPCSNQNGNNICQLGWGGKLHLDSLDKYPAYVVFPQTFGGGWSSADSKGAFPIQPGPPIALLTQLLTYLFKTNPIDLNRVYLYGISAGGKGAYEILLRYPSLFAATSPESCIGDISKASTITDNPIWEIHGEIDSYFSAVYSMRMMDSLAHYGKHPLYTYNTYTKVEQLPNAKLQEPIYTLVKNEGHEVWWHLFNNPVWLQWMFSQNKLRIVPYGNTIIYQGDSIKLSVSAGFDGYEWSTGDTTHSIFVKKAGSYKVRVKRKQYYFEGNSIWSDWSDSISITVKNGTKDVTAPSLPTDLKITEKTDHSFSLQWNASSDNIAVSSYQIYMDSKMITESLINTITIKDLLASSKHSFYVKAKDVVGNSSGSSNVVTATTLGNDHGVSYSYYEGVWDNLPNFDSLKAVKTGTISNIYITPKLKPDGFGFVFQSNVQIDTNGFYTFYLYSDDGSKFIIDNKELILNDGIHETEEKIGSVYLTAGRHSIKLFYFEKNGGETLLLKYDGPGLVKQSIPDDHLFLQFQKDTIPPTIPINLRILNQNQTTLTLGWKASVDVMGVSNYEVIANSNLISKTTDTTISLLNLLPDYNYTFTVRAKDLEGNYSGNSNSVTVKTMGTNHSPKLLPIQAQSMKEGDTLKVTLKAQDADPDSLQFKLLHVPSFAFLKSIGRDTSVLELRPGFTDAGNYTIQAMVSDGRGGVDTVSFELNVVDASSAKGLVLYRVNAGGYAVSANDGNIAWKADNYSNPSSYVKLDSSGNKTFIQTTPVTTDGSVSTSVPSQIFQSERSISYGNKLFYSFPVAKGSEVEVRLYFAENYFKGQGIRKFNIDIEDQLVLTNFDIYQEVGYDVGLMKSFIAQSDGAVDIQLLKVLQNPKINGIEIVCLNSVCDQSNASIPSQKKESLVFQSEDESLVYPNPFSDKIILSNTSSEESFTSCMVLNEMGDVMIQTSFDSATSSKTLDLSSLSKGIYYLKITSGHIQEEKMIRLIKL